VETVTGVQGRTRYKYSPRWWAWQLFDEEVEIPVDVNCAARASGFRVIYTDLGSATGFWDIENSIIYVNELSRITRQRFSLAHELGHAIMQHHPTCARTFNSYQERAANKFAAELLMPGPAAIIIWARVLDLDRKLKEVKLLDPGNGWKLRSFAQQFQVSKLAARIRLKCLGLDDPSIQTR
jgi:Zn-dependent peptidase ImmA (M78 family)